VASGEAVRAELITVVPRLPPCEFIWSWFERLKMMFAEAETYFEMLYSRFVRIEMRSYPPFLTMPS